MLTPTPRAQVRAANAVAAALHDRIKTEDDHFSIRSLDAPARQLHAAILARIQSYIPAILREAAVEQRGYPVFRHALSTYLKALAQDIQLFTALDYIGGTAAELALHLATLDRARRTT